MKTKVLITVDRGNIISVSSTQDIEYLIIDYDNQALGDNPLIGPYDQDNLFENGKSYIEVEGTTESEKEVKDELKRIKF